MSSVNQQIREKNRFQAVRLKESGWKQKDIAVAIGVTEGAVSQWLKKAREEGVEALKHRVPTGRPSRMSAAQLAQLPDLLKRGPEAYGFHGEVWTRPRIAAMIHAEFGIRYEESNVTHLMRKIGWSPQKPTVRARQRDEEAIQTWTDETRPALEKRGRPEPRRYSS